MILTHFPYLYVLIRKDLLIKNKKNLEKENTLIL